MIHESRVHCQAGYLIPKDFARGQHNRLDLVETLKILHFSKFPDDPHWYLY